MMDIDRSAHENTAGINLTDPLFWRCWRRQSCSDCLSKEDNLPCVWCPFSSACLPSSNPRAPLILAPFYDGEDNMCPLGYRERWEVRTRPFGCQVSSITFLTGLVSIFATLLFVGLVALLAWAIKRRVWRVFWRLLPRLKWHRRDDRLANDEGGVTRGVTSERSNPWTTVTNWWRRKDDINTTERETGDGREERDETSPLLP